jgi:hypothetical protein
LLDCWNSGGEYVKYILHFGITVSVQFRSCEGSPDQ